MNSLRWPSLVILVSVLLCTWAVPAVAQFNVDVRVEGSDRAKRMELEDGVKQAVKELSSETNLSWLSLEGHNGRLGSSSVALSVNALASGFYSGTITITGTALTSATVLSPVHVITGSIKHGMGLAVPWASGPFELQQWNILQRGEWLADPLYVASGPKHLNMLVTDFTEYKLAENDGVLMIQATSKAEAYMKTKEALHTVLLLLRVPTKMRANEPEIVTITVLAESRGHPLQASAEFSAVGFEIALSGDQKRVGTGRVDWTPLIRPSQPGRGLMGIRIPEFALTGPVYLNTMGIGSQIIGDTIFPSIYVSEQPWDLMKQMLGAITLLLTIIFTMMRIWKDWNGNKPHEIPS